MSFLETETNSRLYLHRAIRWAFFAISFAAFLYGSIKMFTLDNQKNHRDSTGICIEKFETARGHRKSSRISSEFIMVVREDDGHVYDLNVTPSTYATTKIGDRVTFKHLNKQTLKDDYESMYSILGLMFGSFALVMIIILPGSFSFLNADDIKEKIRDEKHYTMYD